MKGRNNQSSTRSGRIDAYHETHTLKPMNDRQREYIEAIKRDSIIIGIGVLGSSKTYIPAVMAAQMLMNKETTKIVVARPTEGKGKGIGFTPGTSNEKLEDWCIPVTDTLRQELGISNYEYLLHNGTIELLDLCKVKGRSWDDTIILVDEAEDLEPAVAKSLVTRIGQRSKIIITGDIAQQDLMRASGLQRLLAVAQYAHVPVTVIDFDDWKYCVRSDEAKLWGMAFEEYERAHADA